MHTHTEIIRLNENETERKMREKHTFHHLFHIHGSICLYSSSPQEKQASKLVIQPLIMLTLRCCYQLSIDGQLLLTAWCDTVGQEDGSPAVS